MTQQGEEVAQPPYPREPNVHSGGKQDPGGDRELPPYADRQTSGPTQEEQVKDPQKRGEGISDQREISQAEREGVSATDTTAASPLGVGESIVKQGNERMYGRSDEAHTSDQVDVGVGGRTENIDPESPTALQGDQGG